MRALHFGLLALFLSACATTAHNELDMMTPDKWLETGFIDNHVHHAIDRTSIHQVSHNVMRFKDRKILEGAGSDSDTGGLPYHEAYSTWEIDCAAKTFRLIETTLQDKDEYTIAHFDYLQNPLSPKVIEPHTIAARQYRLVCGKAI